MNTLHRLSILSGTLLAAGLALASCQKSVVENPEAEGEGLQEVTLVVKGGIHRWDATKADTTPLDINGSILYIGLDNGYKEIPLRAEYVVTTESAAWHLNFDSGALDGVTDGKARCYYIENATNINRGILTLNDRSIIYQDEEATYQFDGERIVLNTNLAPKTGRINFLTPADSDSYTIYVHGVSYYNQFDAKTLTFSSRCSSYDWDTYQFLYRSTDDPAYLYVFFTDPGDPTLFVSNRSNASERDRYYERTFDPDILAPGHSVACQVPSQYYHNEWREFEKRKYYSFTSFYFVPRGTFTMGGGEFVPEHPVTLTKGYYLSYREISRDQWYEIMGEPEEFNDSSQPVTGKTWDEIQGFIAALNSQAEGRVTFRLPTEAEWEWAARGAFFSYNYRYSGTQSPEATINLNDGLTEVSGDSWVTNELNLTDMSGNAGEFCADWFGPYSADAQTDPTGPSTGTYRVIRGGDIFSPDEGVTVYARATLETASLETTGFRLLMEVPEP